MKKVIIFLSICTYLLIITSNVNKTNKFEDIITMLLIFNILLVVLAGFINFKKKNNEKNIIK